jgi:hypothetical protein
MRRLGAEPVPLVWLTFSAGKPAATSEPGTYARPQEITILACGVACGARLVTETNPHRDGRYPPIPHRG